MGMGLHKLPPLPARPAKWGGAECDVIVLTSARRRGPRENGAETRGETCAGSRPCRRNPTRVPTTTRTCSEDDENGCGNDRRARTMAVAAAASKRGSLPAPPAADTPALRGEACLLLCRAVALAA
eukprot:scaffold5048_cov338-Prasinococcus_capsulatus_cf.AAC.10